MSKSYFQWQDDNKVYRDFAPNIDRQLYAAFTSGAESIDVDLPSLGVYTINFKHMTQSQKSNQHRWRRIQYLGVASKNNSLGASSSSPQQFAGGNSRNLNPPNEKVSLAPEAYATFTISIKGELFALVPDPDTPKAVMLTKVWMTPANHPWPDIPVIRYATAWYKHTDRGLYPKQKTFSRYDDRADTPAVWPGTEHTPPYLQATPYVAPATASSPLVGPASPSTAQSSISGQAAARSSSASSASLEQALSENAQLKARIEVLESEKTRVIAEHDELYRIASQLQTEGRIMFELLRKYKLDAEIPLYRQQQQQQQAAAQQDLQQPGGPEVQHRTPSPAEAELQLQESLANTKAKETADRLEAERFRLEQLQMLPQGPNPAAHPMPQVPATFKLTPEQMMQLNSIQAQHPDPGSPPRR